MVERRNGTDRGQMEVLGFVIVFGIVVTSIALLGVTGFGGLNDVRETEKASNAARVFEVLHDNVEDLIDGDAPYRATEVKMADSQLTLGEPTVVEVRGYHAGNMTFNYTEEVRPIEYMVTDETTLVYVDGAVIRDDRGDAVMLEEPSLVFTSEAVNIPIVETRPTWQHASVGGTRSVNLRTQLTGTQALVTDTRAHTVELSVTSPYPEVWERYFRSLEHTSLERTGDTVTVRIDTDRVYVNTNRIDVLFD